jgi:hypothetical protein
LLLLSFALHADYQDGLDAYTYGDYATAMQEWRTVTDGPATAVSPAVYVEAHYAVAMLYWQGEGVAVDYRQAHDWLLKAAERGHAGAQAKLGFLYTDGKGVARDHGQAFEWFSKAAKGGNVDGLYNLGIFYLYGWGVEADKPLAAQYLAAAAALGDESAERALPGVLAEIEQERLTAPATANLIRDPPTIAPDELPVEPVASDRVLTESMEPGLSRATPAPAEEHPAGSQDGRAPGSFLWDETWIRAQDPIRYTIQVIALSSRQRLEDLVRGFEEAGPFAFYVVQKSSKPLYVLVQGSYPDAKAARAAGARIPAAIQRQDELWVRRFDGVQASLE